MQWKGRATFVNLHSQFLYLLGKNAPLRKRHIRANQKNLMDRELNQAIMVKSKLRNKFLKLKTEENRLACAKQRNYFSSINVISYSKKQYLHFSLKKKMNLITTK